MISVKPDTNFEPLMISLIPVMSAVLSLGSVNQGFVKMPTLPEELVRPMRPREVVPVELDLYSIEIGNASGQRTYR